MPLASGTRIGGYEIIAPIGAGGMGEVYRARDARLGRDVAIKVLSPAIAADTDALMRFEREARALASLNHPNIAAIYGVEDTDGQPALILEVVDGLTLADRIARDRVIPVAEALAIAKQIAEALDTAHESGIVHRDLKPANIKITEDGRVKVLDFGLAKAIAAAGAPDPAEFDPAHSPTITVTGTKHGVILGTVAYMSPEQARGKAIDKRTDIWAFGCVLYEMLTGTRAFNGETTSDVIAAIIERHPDLGNLPPSVPPHLRRVLERCLAKDPKHRARDIADVRAEMDHVATPAVPMRPSWWRAAAIPLAVVSIVTVLGVAAWRWSVLPLPAPEPIEFTFGPPPGHTLTLTPTTVSPDGRLLAFVAQDDRQVPSLWIRPIAGSSPRRLAGTEGVRSSGHWSPDGRSIAFFAANTWKRIAVEGGTPITLASDIIANLGASWGADDTILLSPANRAALVRVPASGGAVPTPVTTLDTEKENSHRWPFLLPDGRHFLFTVRSDRPENLGIKLGAFDSKEIRTLVNIPSPGVYANGWLLFMTPDEVLMGQRLDPATWTLSGERQPVAAPVSYNGPSFSGVFSASRDGRVLTYVPASQSASRIVWFDRSGKSGGTVGPPQRYLSIAVARDGRTIAAELASERYGTRDIWLIDATTQALTRFTSNPATDWRPVFSPDGNSIAFASDRAGASTVLRVATNGTGGESVLYRDPSGGGAFPQDWSGDGKKLLVNIDSSQARGSVKFVIVPIDGTASTVLLEESGAVMNMPNISPDGTRIAFAMGAPGAFDVYVMSIVDRRRARVSIDGGWNPVWGPDGRELFFQNARGILRASLSPDGVSVVVPPDVLFHPCQDMPGFRFDTNPAKINYDVTADGRFIALCDPEDAAPASVTVVVNWQSKLR